MNPNAGAAVVCTGYAALQLGGGAAPASDERLRQSLLWLLQHPNLTERQPHRAGSSEGRAAPAGYGAPFDTSSLQCDSAVPCSINLPALASNQICRSKNFPIEISDLFIREVLIRKETLVKHNVKRNHDFNHQKMRAWKEVYRAVRAVFPSFSCSFGALKSHWRYRLSRVRAVVHPMTRLSDNGADGAALRSRLTATDWTIYNTLKSTGYTGYSSKSHLETSGITDILSPYEQIASFNVRIGINRPNGGKSDEERRLRMELISQQTRFFMSMNDLVANGKNDAGAHSATEKYFSYLDQRSITFYRECNVILSEDCYLNPSLQ